MSRRLAIFSLCVIGALAGCGRKLNIDKTLDLSKGGKIVTLDPVGSEQKVKISIVAEDAPVDIFVYLGKDAQKAEENLYGAKAPVLKKELKTQKIENMEVTIPANEEAHINVQPSTRSPKSVSLKITN